MIKKTGFLGILFALLLIWNCVPEAPHSNPLDPYHTVTSHGIELRGHILQKNEPHNPVDSCMVFLSPGNLFRIANQNGEFTFSGLTSGLYELVISHSGYDTDTFQVATDTLGPSLVHFYLNGLPYLKKSLIYSEFIDQWWPDPYSTVNISVQVDDPDGAGDISEVQVHIPAMNLNWPMENIFRPDSFFLHLFQDDFPENDIVELIGKEVRINITYKSGAATEEGPFYLYRIIETSPIPIEPVALQVVTPLPLLRWEQYIATFAFTYEVAVFRVNTAGLPIQIHSVTRLPSTQLEYAYPDSLTSGTYFWTVGVRDELGNFSRSKEASFVVP